MFQLSSREPLVGLELLWPTPVMYDKAFGAMPVAVVPGLDSKERNERDNSSVDLVSWTSQNHTLAGRDLYMNGG